MSSGIFHVSNKEKDKQRKAKRAIISFLKKFEKTKKKIENAEEWYDSVKELEPILDHYKDDLPRDVYEKLKNSIHITDKTFEGIKTASKVLSFELKAANAILPAMGVPSSIVIGASIIVAVIIGSMVIVSSLVFVDITITNYECEDIPVLAPLTSLDERFADLGLFFNLPDKISTNTSETIRIPPGNIEFDGLKSGKIIVKSDYMTIPFDVPRTIKSLDFEGTDLLGQQTIVEINGASDHELTINCK